MFEGSEEFEEAREGEGGGMGKDPSQREGMGDLGDPGSEGHGAAEATPPIGEEGEVGQTQTPAPDDDVGTPEEPGANET
jgi:hypothetical protein